MSFVAAFSVSAMEQAFVPSSDLSGSAKFQSDFDSWSPSAARRQTYFDHNHTSAWESRQWLNYRASDNQSATTRVSPDSDLVPSLSQSIAPTLPWKPLSMTSAYEVWDDLDFPIAFSLSVQPRVSDENVNVQETVVIGRNYDFWSWALNFSQGNEWSNRLKERDGDMELGLGLARALGPNWSIGVELLDHSEMPEYRRLAGNKVFLGPVIRCHKDNWWMAFSVMPRVLGFDYVANFDTPRDIEFDSNQKLTTRVMFGLCF